jgi:hypothetical protein
MAKDEQAVWATDGEMLEEIELSDVDDTGDGYGAEPLESVDLEVGDDEPEEGAEVELAAAPDNLDALLEQLASAIFSRDEERVMHELIVRESDAELNRRRIAYSALKRHCTRLEVRCRELTEMLSIYEQEMGWPPVVRSRPGLLGRLLQAVWPWG